MPNGTDVINSVENKMPDRLKDEIGMLHEVKIYEDVIQIVLFNKGAGELIIWLYKSGEDTWHRILLK